MRCFYYVTISFLKRKVEYLNQLNKNSARFPKQGQIYFRGKKEDGVISRRVVNNGVPGSKQYLPKFLICRVSIIRPLFIHVSLTNGFIHWFKSKTITNLLHSYLSFISLKVMLIPQMYCLLLGVGRNIFGRL
jgi:hypothetical protein